MKAVNETKASSSASKHADHDNSESTVVLEEQRDGYEPTEEGIPNSYLRAIEINEYATYMGMDPGADKDLLWIAKEGLKAPVPGPWKPCRTAKGDIYYFNFENGQSSWEHPCDQHYKKLYQQEKEKRKRLADIRLSQRREEEKRAAKQMQATIPSCDPSDRN